ncbi:hypothetical protein GF312_09790 [Candidatus Poribacteria bacterium]|nr:hypothetical protein [Candidatus Poribacteria bacterium]
MKGYFIRILVILFFITITTGVYAVRDDDLLLYLSFDEGAGVEARDSSGNENHGVINGDVQWTVGKSGKALEFAGDITQYVEVPDDESLRFDDGPFTYTAWIKTYELDTAQSQLIISKRVPVAGDGMETASLFIKSGTDHLFVEFRDSIKGMFGYDAMDAVITANNWHHVAWVKNDTELKFYVDGELKESVNHERDGTVNGTQPLYVGVHRYGNTWNSPFIGIIDEVAVFKAELTDAEIIQAMNSVLAVKATGKISGLWGRIKSDH